MMKNFAFLVSCQNYESAAYDDLIGIEADTDKMKQVLIDNCGCDEDSIVLCTSDEKSNYHPERNSILKMIATEGTKHIDEVYDICFFYFSGHGHSYSENEVMLVPSDTNVDLEIHPIAVNSIVRLIRKHFKFTHIVLFLDVCQSALQSKSSQTSYNSKAIFPEGVIVFYSCSPNSASYMFPPSHISDDWKGSIFTYCLVQALDPESNCCTVGQISQEVKNRMIGICQMLDINQHPHTSLQDDSQNSIIITCNYTGNDSMQDDNKHRTEVRKVFDILVRDHPDVCDYAFVRDIHTMVLHRIDDDHFRGEMKLMLQDGIQQLKRNCILEYKKDSVLKRCFAIYYCLGMFYKRNDAHWGDEDTLESIVREYSGFFEFFILNLEVLSWYYRRAADYSTDEKKREFLQKAFENDKKMMNDLSLEKNAGVYASFASTVGRSLEAMYVGDDTAISPWNNDYEREYDWCSACEYFDGPSGIIEMYKKIWGTQTAYGKHYYLWGKLIMFDPKMDTKSPHEQIRALNFAETKFRLALSAESKSTKGKELSDRKSKYRDYINKCVDRIAELTKTGTGDRKPIIVHVQGETEENKREGLNKPNEDNFRFEYSDEWGIFVIADGVTRPHEEYESSTAGRNAAANLAEDICRGIVASVRGRIDETKKNPEQSLRKILLKYNAKLNYKRKKYLQSGNYPVCTTLLMVFIYDGKMFFFNCCDTIGYIIRNGLKIQFTEYYNWLSDVHQNPKEMVYSEIQNNFSHPDGFGIINGSSRLEDFINIGHIQLEKGDRIVLSSDGMASYLKASRAAKLKNLSAEELIQDSVAYDCLPFSKYADDKTCILIDIQ